jgi:hypothetical protein
MRNRIAMIDQAVCIRNGTRDDIAAITEVISAAFATLEISVKALARR